MMTHSLPAPLQVNITSYPKRFRTLHRTLRSLLAQDVSPFTVVLWIAHDDLSRLPSSVRQLTRRGLSVQACEDLKQYKKLVPALRAAPTSFHVTADDDVFYPPSWLRDLVEGYIKGEPAIVCHRAHRILFDADGKITPYSAWQGNVQDKRALEPSTDLVPTGVGGVLYPPDTLDPHVVNMAEAMRLCPTTDDLWFYAMARRRGTVHRKVGGEFIIAPWPGTQDERLFNANVEADGNDRQFAQVRAAYPFSIHATFAK